MSEKEPFDGAPVSPEAIPGQPVIPQETAKAVGHGAVQHELERRRLPGVTYHDMTGRGSKQYRRTIGPVGNAR